MQKQRLFSLLGNCGCQRQNEYGPCDDHNWRGFPPASSGQMLDNSLCKHNAIQQNGYRIAIFEDTMFSR